MAISHFKISKLPSSDIISLIGNDILLTDTLYPIARQNEIVFKRSDTLEGYYVSEKFSYQVYEEDLTRYGNVAESVIEWKENDLATLLVSADLTIEMERGNTISLLDYISINKAVEYIYITEANGVNTTQNNGVPIVPGNRLSPSELSKATFETIQGGGAPYFELKYKLGRGGDLSDEVYTFAIDVEAIAEISLIDSSSNRYLDPDINGFPVDYMNSSFEMKVENAVSLSDVVLEVTSTIPWISNGDDHYIEVSAGGVITNPIVSPDVAQITARADSNGIIDVLITSEAQVNGNIIAGNISVKVISVNGDIALVSPINHTAIAEINSEV